jgi:hypothetical protein
MNHKHYTFQLVDKTPKDKLPKGGPFTLGMYLKAKMYYYIAQNNLQGEMKGDEQDYINMLATEYAVSEGEAI